MTLYIVGLGLADEKDITLKGLEAVKKCDLVYLEGYTSFLQCDLNNLEELYGKKIIPANRESSEQGATKIITEAKDENVAFLVIGDPFSATTHIELFRLAKENKVEVKVIHNASVLTAIGITGLQLYKFGKTTSIPYLDEQPNLETPYHIIKQNKDLHTLCLLDIKAEENRFMSVNEGIAVLEDIERRLKEGVIHDDLLIVGCARLGTDDSVIKAGKLSELKKMDFGKQPHCLIIPGKLHFVEEEMMEIGE